MLHSLKAWRYFSRQRSKQKYFSRQRRRTGFFVRRLSSGKSALHHSHFSQDQPRLSHRLPGNAANPILVPLIRWLARRPPWPLATRLGATRSRFIHHSNPGAVFMANPSPVRYFFLIPRLRHPSACARPKHESTEGREQSIACGASHFFFTVGASDIPLNSFFAAQ